MRTLRSPGGKGLLHLGCIAMVKGAIGGMVGAIVRWRLLMSQRATKPVPFDVGHVPHEPEQRQRRRRDCPPAQLFRRQATALPLQGETVKVEPGLEHLPFRGRSRWCWSRDLHSTPPRTRYHGRVLCKGLRTTSRPALTCYATEDNMMRP